MQSDVFTKIYQYLNYLIRVKRDSLKWLSLFVCINEIVIYNIVIIYLNKEWYDRNTDKLCFR